MKAHFHPAHSVPMCCRSLKLMILCILSCMHTEIVCMHTHARAHTLTHVHVHTLTHTCACSRPSSRPLMPTRFSSDAPPSARFMSGKSHATLSPALSPFNSKKSCSAQSKSGTQLCIELPTSLQEEGGLPSCHPSTSRARATPSLHTPRAGLATHPSLNGRASPARAHDQMAARGNHPGGRLESTWLGSSLYRLTVVEGRRPSFSCHRASLAGGTDQGGPPPARHEAHSCQQVLRLSIDGRGAHKVLAELE